MSQAFPLFVYGTLLPGASNANVAERLGCAHFGPARLPGDAGFRLVHCGTMPYPHLVAHHPGAPVLGFLLRVPQAAWSALDAFEDVDDEYERVLVSVVTDSDTKLAAYCYRAQAGFPLSDPAPVPDGDWLTYWRRFPP